MVNQKMSRLLRNWKSFQKNISWFWAGFFENWLFRSGTIYYDATLSGYLGVSDYLVGDGGNLIAYNIPNSDPSNVPEPATWTLLVLSLLALLLHRRYSSI